MPYELGRALLISEAVTPAALARALFVVAAEGAPLPRVLVALELITAERLDEELARADVPTVNNVVPVQELVDALPKGLCSRLLALPIRMDARTGTVDVAVADARDPHGAHEIGFFLKAPVRIVRAPLVALERALERSESGMTAPTGTAVTEIYHGPGPTFTTVQNGREAREFGFARSIWSKPDPKIKETPMWGTPVPRALPQLAAVPAATGMSDGIESDLPPVLRPPSVPNLTRAMPRAVAHALLSNESAFLPAARHPSYPPNAPTLPFPDASRVIAAMRAALDRDEVLHALLGGARVVARKVALFAVRRDAFMGWRCTPEFGDEAELRKIRIPVSLPSALATAATAGRYLGPVYKTEAHAPLLEVMGKATRDIAMTVVRVRGIATMLVIADELGDSMLATQRIEELARVAGEALTRILRRSR